LCGRETSNVLEWLAWLCITSLFRNLRNWDNLNSIPFFFYITIIYHSCALHALFWLVLKTFESYVEQYAMLVTESRAAWHSNLVPTMHFSDWESEAILELIKAQFTSLYSLLIGWSRYFPEIKILDQWRHTITIFVQ